ncbi:helix-turn-helix domain-containing protein (plasmid) [Bacillus sp. N447-1]|nr:helix-turn-helix domain-containing protein [Bacillus sp. N447-1]
MTSMPILAEATRNPLLDRFMKDLIVQILEMIAEMERTESKRRPLLYSANAKNPQKRLVYQEVVRMLKSGTPIKQIAEKNAITQSTVYRIKKELAE